MPYFTRQVAPQGGLILAAFIGVSEARRRMLTTLNMLIPEPVPVSALVDTGASCTCVDTAVLRKLNLTPTGSATINTPSTGTQPAVANQYDVSLIILSMPSVPALHHNTMPVIESALFGSQGFHVLLGRDVLGGCLLSYDGVNGLFTLAY